MGRSMELIGYLLNSAQPAFDVGDLRENKGKKALSRRGISQEDRAAQMKDRFICAALSSCVADEKSGGER